MNETVAKQRNNRGHRSFLRCETVMIAWQPYQRVREAITLCLKGLWCMLP